MNIKNMQEALNVLIPHYKEPGSEFLSAEHDEIYFPPTDTPLNDEERAKLNDLGVFQEDADEDDDGNPTEYLPEDGWKTFT